MDIETPEDMRKLMTGVAVATIGPVTAKTAENLGLKIDVQPAEYTIQNLVNCIVTYFTSKRAGSWSPHIDLSQHSVSQDR